MLPVGKRVVRRFEGLDVAFLVTGVGARRTRRSLEEAFEQGGTLRLLLIGICGGVDPALQTGETLFPSRVQDLSGEMVFERDRSPWRWLEDALGRRDAPVRPGGDWVTAPHMLDTTEKQRLWQANSNIRGVDLEALEVARFARERSTAWAVLKTVADPSDFVLPPKESFPSFFHEREESGGESTEPNAREISLRLFESRIDAAVKANTHVVKDVLPFCPH